MKKYFILIFIALLAFVISCKTPPSPKLAAYIPKPAAKNAGNLMGRIEVTNDRGYWALKEGTHIQNIKVFIMRKSDKKVYKAATRDGYYYFFNLPAGEYKFWRWQLDIPTGMDITTYLLNEVKDYDFTIEEKTITVLKTIQVKALIPKEFTYKINYITDFTFPKSDELKLVFDSRDKDGLYKDYEWKSPVMADSMASQLDDATLIQQQVSISDNDYYSMDGLYKSGDYYLSFLLFYRIEESLLKAVYIKNVGRDLPKTGDLKELAKQAKLTLTADQLLLLNDLNTFNTRIKKGDTDENFQALFTREYFEGYLIKINALRDFLKEQLK